MAPKKNTGVYIVAFSLLLLGLGYLIFTGLSEDSAYFLTVSEALAMDPKDLGKARLFGKVDANGLTSKAGSLGVKFRLLDKEDRGKYIWVDYAGAVPDTFKPGVEVIVGGGLQSDTGVFQAGTLMTKCPSKYKKKLEQG
ncbi:MAG: cytochrome c maturation protein CcmE [Thermodesulfobacteriota bacterium]|nr:cytochrome c maturation protein CcmE [Thermodesulfobacteriota bacterium]